MFFKEIEELLLHIQTKKNKKIYNAKSQNPWPEDVNSKMIFKEELGAELGGPNGSVFVNWIWKDVVDGGITLIGSNKFKPKIPWGRLTLVNTEIEDEENYYSYLQQLNMIPLKYSIEGIMVKLQPSAYKEWIKIHKDYIKTHTIVQYISRLYHLYKKLPWVKDVEFLVITSSLNDIFMLQPLVEKHKKLLQTLEKRLTEHIKNCDNCENNVVCSKINKFLKKEKNNAK